MTGNICETLDRLREKLQAVRSKLNEYHISNLKEKTEEIALILRIPLDKGESTEISLSTIPQYIQKKVLLRMINPIYYMRTRLGEDPLSCIKPFPIVISLNHTMVHTYKSLRANGYQSLFCVRPQLELLFDRISQTGVFIVYSDKPKNYTNFILDQIRKNMLSPNIPEPKVMTLNTGSNMKYKALKYIPNVEQPYLIIVDDNPLKWANPSDRRFVILSRRYAGKKDDASKNIPLDDPLPFFFEDDLYLTDAYKRLYTVSSILTI